MIRIILFILLHTKNAFSETASSVVSPSRNLVEESFQIAIGQNTNDLLSATIVTQNGFTQSATDEYSHTVKGHLVMNSGSISVTKEALSMLTTNTSTFNIDSSVMPASIITSHITIKINASSISASKHIIQSISVNIVKNNQNTLSSVSFPINITCTRNASKSVKNKSSIAIPTPNSNTKKLATTKNTHFVLNPGTTLQDFCTKIKLPERFCVCPDLGAVCAFFSSKKKAKVKKILVCREIHRIQMYFNIVICSIGIIGNLLALMVYSSNKTRMKTVCRKLIAMLSLTDTVFCALQQTISLPKSWTCDWIYNVAMCKFITSMLNSTATMALGFILIISAERFNGIVKPFSIKKSDKKVYIFSAVNIMISIVVVIPAILVLQVEVTVNGEYVCSEKWPDKKYSLAYSWFLLLFTFVLPICIIASYYRGIVKSLRKSQLHTQKTFDRSQQTRRRKEDTRITTIIACLLFNFVFLVSPNRIIWVLYDHGVFKNLTSDQLSYIKIASGIPYTIHACVNPLIYSVVDKKFCGDLLMLYYRLTCRHKTMVAAKNSKQYSLGPERRCTSMSSVNARQTTSSFGTHLEVCDAREVNNNTIAE